MIDVISTKDSARLAAKLRRIRARAVAFDRDLMNQVAMIADDVRARGDAALIEYARQFDQSAMEVEDLRVDEKLLREMASTVDPTVVDALREAIKRVRAFHEREREHSWVINRASGVRVGQRVMPIERVGVYVPGGSAGYPSSVVMNIVPAQVAGVERIIVATPPAMLQQTPAIAAALVELNVTEVFAVGGSQAIAALAFGTQTIPRVDKIVGPGNRFVTAAKKHVFGIVGIDSLAGPSEVIVLADDSARPRFVAADLLAQAEHSEDASAILITNSEELAIQVVDELASQTARLPRAAIIEKSLADYGAIIVADELDEAYELVNELAPEHLEIIAREADAIAPRIKNAGAIFFGEFSPEAVGDYLAGPNHVLPTSGTARFASALSVRDFVKHTSTIKFTAEELGRTAPWIAALARAEGLEAHARSALARLDAN